MKFNHNHEEKGQSLVELALTLLIILTLLAGAVDLGSAFFSYVAIRDAAQEGALFGSIKPIVDLDNDGRYDLGEPLNTSDYTANPDTIDKRVRQSSNRPINLNDFVLKICNSQPPNAIGWIEVCFSDPPCSAGSAGWIRVSVRYNYRLYMPFIGAILGTSTIPLTASVTDTILNPACPTPTP